MEYNLYVFSFGSFLLLVFSVHMLFTKHGNTYLNRFLAAMMMMRGFQILYFIAIKTGITSLVSLFLDTLGPILFVYPAFLYLYVRGFIQDESRFQKRDLVHFFPLVLALLDMLPWYFLDSQERDSFIEMLIDQKLFYVKENFGLFPYSFSSWFRNGLLIFYFIAIWRLIFRSGILKNKKNNPVVANWILFFVVITSLSNINLLVNSTLVHIWGFSVGNQFLGNYRVFIQSSILLVFFAYVFYNPKVLYGFVFVAKDFGDASGKFQSTNSDQGIFLEETNNIFSERSEGSRKKFGTLTEEKISLQINRMNSLIESEKLFLNPEFSLAELAVKLDLPSHHCSYILNECIGKNFRDWVNSYRIEYFIKEYPKLIKSQTIVSIALRSGFKNKNTFYSAFEKVTGQNPSQYFGN